MVPEPDSQIPVPVCARSCRDPQHPNETTSEFQLFVRPSPSFSLIIQRWHTLPEKSVSLHQPVPLLVLQGESRHPSPSPPIHLTFENLWVIALLFWQANGYFQQLH